VLGRHPEGLAELVDRGCQWGFVPVFQAGDFLMGEVSQARQLLLVEPRPFAQRPQPPASTDRVCPPAGDHITRMGKRSGRQDIGLGEA